MSRRYIKIRNFSKPEIISKGFYANMHFLIFRFFFYFFVLVILDSVGIRKGIAHPRVLEAQTLAQLRAHSCGQRTAEGDS